MGKYPGWRHMTAAQRYNARKDNIFETARNAPVARFFAATGQRPHWHHASPWAYSLVYVPIAELAACTMHLGQLCARADGGESFIMTPQTNLEHWQQSGDKLDAYILPSPSGDHSGGIRYGAEGSEYLSPYFDSAKLQALLDKYLI